MSGLAHGGTVARRNRAAKHLRAVGLAGADLLRLLTERRLARVTWAGDRRRLARGEDQPVHLREAGRAVFGPATQENAGQRFTAGCEDRAAARVGVPERLVDRGGNDRLAQVGAVFAATV